MALLGITAFFSLLALVYGCTLPSYLLDSDWDTSTLGQLTFSGSALGPYTVGPYGDYYFDCFLQVGSKYILRSTEKKTILSQEQYFYLCLDFRFQTSNKYLLYLRTTEEAAANNQRVKIIQATVLPTSNQVCDATIPTEQFITMEKKVNPPDVEHVMISYQWDSKPIMLKLKDRLKSVGYKVWMDVEHMSGSTLEAMALAVERAAVVVVAMSKKYKDSPNCRTEAEYTHKLHKAVLPLQVEENYIPDGWLGMLVGTRLYIPVLNPAHVEVAFSKITSELGTRGKPVLTHYNQDREVGNDIPSGALRNLDDWRQWDEKSVSEWMRSTGMTNKFPDMDGSLLYEVRKIADKAPDYLYQTLQSELKLSFKEILQLSKALASLDKDSCFD